MLKLLFFDTETTGLPVDNDLQFVAVDYFPRLVELAYVLCYEDGSVISEATNIIRPNGFIIPEEVIPFHGITTEKAIKEGIEVHRVLSDFFCQVVKADLLVAHNFRFDYNIIGAEAHRAGIDELYHEFFKSRKSICTKSSAAMVFNKVMSVNQLYQHLFGCSIDLMGKALSDTKACAKCFFELKSKGYFPVFQKTGFNINI